MPQREGSPPDFQGQWLQDMNRQITLRHCYINFADNIKVFWFSLQSSFLDASLPWISDMSNFLISFIKIPHFVINSAVCKNTSFLIFRSRIIQQNNASYIFKNYKVCFWKISPVVSGKYCWLFCSAVQNLIRNKSAKNIPGRTFPIPLTKIQATNYYLQAKTYTLVSYFLISHLQQLGRHSFFPLQLQ